MNGGWVLVLVVATNSFILAIFAATADATVKVGGALQSVDTLPMLIAAIISCGVLLTIPHYAAGLSGGMSIGPESMGRAAVGMLRRGGRGAMDRMTNKRGRDNQRQAEDQVDIARRREKHEDRLEQRRKRRQPKNVIASNDEGRQEAAN
jgi:hypothetical protein